MSFVNNLPRLAPNSTELHPATYATSASVSPARQATLRAACAGNLLQAAISTTPQQGQHEGTLVPPLALTNTPVQTQDMQSVGQPLQTQCMNSQQCWSPPQEALQDTATLDEHFMRMALEQAQLAALSGEVPVGAVLVAADRHTVLAAAHNEGHASQNPIAHAEVLAIVRAAGQVGGRMLQGATLYCTVEPCPMCAGAILQARLGRLVYGARQPRLGADGSWVSLFPPPPLTPRQVQQQRQALRWRRRQRQQHLRYQHKSNQQLRPQQQQQECLDLDHDEAMQEQRKYTQHTQQHGEGQDQLQLHLQQCCEPHLQASREQQQQQQQRFGGTTPLHSPQAPPVTTTLWSGQGSDKYEAAISSIGLNTRDAFKLDQQQVSALKASQSMHTAPVLQKLIHPFHNRIHVVRGVLEQECAQVMRNFFRARRGKLALVTQDKQGS